MEHSLGEANCRQRIPWCLKCDSCEKVNDLTTVCSVLQPVLSVMVQVTNYHKPHASHNY